MKAGQFLKLYHTGSSDAVVVMHFYDNRTGKTERAELSRSEVSNIDRCDFEFKTFRVESFSIARDTLLDRVVMDVYTSFTSALTAEHNHATV